MAVADIPEKFLVTSKVVNMAPCSDRREGRKEGRDRNSVFDKLAARKRSTVKRQAKGLSPHYGQKEPGLETWSLRRLLSVSPSVSSWR